MIRVALPLITTAILLPTTAAQNPTAQDPADGGPAVARPDTALLRRACARMGKLAGVAWRTIEAQDSAMTRSLKRQMGGLGAVAGIGGDDIEVSGTWCNGVLHASIDGDADEVVLHAGRAVAREDEGPWKQRRDTLAGGAPMPFLFDPELFFEILNGLSPNDFAVRHTEETSYRDQNVVILGVTVDGGTAGDLQHTGIVPRPTPGSRILVAGPGARLGAGGGINSDAILDLAFFVDPETALVHRVRIKAYAKSSGVPGMVFRVAGGGGNEQPEAEEVREFDADGRRIYKRGLPVRALDDDVSMVDFDIRFSEHGKTFKVQLDRGIRRYLKMLEDR